MLSFASETAEEALCAECGEESARSGKDPVGDAERCVAVLDDLYREASTEELLRAMITGQFAGRICVISSFGSESATLLHQVSRIDPATPVLFIDTGKLFGETLRYRDRLIDELGLTDVRTISPTPARMKAFDENGILWSEDPGLCCHLRKVEPLRRGLMGFDAWICGRKRFQGADRADLPRFEADRQPAPNGEPIWRVKINPLADWDKERLDRYFADHALPRHPLEADGFLSVGCMPCTDRVAPGESARAGRWRGMEKSECGIHAPWSKRR